MKKFIPLALALGLWAADSWQNKPAAEWSDKDVQKVLTNSPWSKNVGVAAGGPTDSGIMPGRDGRGIGGDESQGRTGATQMPGAGAGIPGGNVPSRTLDGPESQTAMSIPILVVWESALPVKQALARRKFGAEAGTSPEAKKFLDENGSYLIAVSGIPPSFAREIQMKAAILHNTSLAVKGKEPLHPTDIQTGGVNGMSNKDVEAIFIFPKTTAFDAGDKEVEFSTQLGPASIRCKFRLKDMLYQGKLEL